MIPYTYRIQCITTGEYYYGVKYGKDADPSTFWINYFTSSDKVKNLIKLYGVDNFVFTIRKIFNSAEAAILWEHKVLKRVMNWDNYLNRHSGKAFSIKSTMKGLETQKQKWLSGEYDYLRDKSRLAGIKAAATNKKNKTSMCWDKNIQSAAGKKAQITLNRIGYFQSSKWRKVSSRANTTWITNGVDNKRYDNLKLNEFLNNNKQWRIGTTKNVVIPNNKGTIYLWDKTNTTRTSVQPFSNKYYDLISDGYYSKNGKHGIINEEYLK